MHKLAVSALTLSGALLLPFAAAKGAEESPIVARDINVAMPADARVQLDLPVGELEIIGTTGEHLRAHLEIACKRDSSSCAKRAERVQFASRRNGQEVSLAVTPSGMKAYNWGHVRIRIEVPAAETVEIEFGAGELTVSDVDACVQLRMFAGEADLQLDASNVDAVDLRAAFGESTLYLDDESVEGERPFLVGSKVQYAHGAGPCDLEASLRFGEITAHLH